MGQCNHVLISTLRIQEVRDETEDFWRDLVDWCESVPPGPNQAENLESISLENVDLEYATY